MATWTSEAAQPPAARALSADVRSLLISLTGAAAVGLAVLAAAKLGGVLGSALLYHAVVFGACFGLYMTMPGGFAANFNVPQDSKKGMSVADVMYYTLVVHSTAGFGDIYPTSFYGRTVVSMHLGLVFLAVAQLIPLGR